MPATPPAPPAAGTRYQMLWDCPRCDTPKLLGLSHRNCPACGAPQDPARRYYPADADKIAVEDHPFVGADKQCAGCDAPNAASAAFCVGCGNSLEGAGPVTARATQTAGAAGFTADSARAADAERAAARQAAHAPPPKPRSGGIGIGVAVVLLLVCAGAAALFWKKDAGVTVAGRDWSRDIAVEQLQTVTDSAWKDGVPAEARGVTCAEAQRSTRQVPDGETCVDERHDNADGTFTEAKKCTPKTRDEPVMDQKCSFTVDRWVETRTVHAGGAGATPAPAWPTSGVAGGTVVGSEREGKRTETYTVRFTDDKGRALACTPAQEVWATLTEGSRWNAPVGVLSDSIDCSALKPL